MDLILQRVRLLPDRTAGQLYINGEFFCFTLEDTVRPDPKPETPENEGKVYGQTAIPTGLYDVVLEKSPKFGPDTISILRVPGFTGIRMHAGNTELDTLGCILLGYKVEEVGKIKAGSSRPAVADLKVRLKKTIQSGEKVTIRILNPN